jgi:hypothetical protein
MKRFLSYWGLGLVIACGTTTTGVDGGGTDASSDSGSSNDGTAADTSTGNDTGTVDGSGDGGGLQVGDTCDPNKNLCSAGLLCCSEPTHNADAMTGYFCEKPVNKSCPQLP